MNKIWYIVANRTKARIFQQEGPGENIELLEELMNPKGKLKDGELVSDRMGRPQPGYQTYSYDQSPRERVLQTFSKEIADYLHKQTLKQSIGSITLFAETRLLGYLKKQLSPSVLGRLSAAVSKDFSGLSDQKLIQYLTQYRSQTPFRADSVLPTVGERGSS